MELSKPEKCDVIIYGIKNCDTCKKALNWLKEEGIDHRYHDFRKDGLDRERIAGWLAVAGPEVLINRRGTTYRKLDEAARVRLDGADAAALLAEQPTLIKRPVFELGDKLIVGFKDAEKASLLAAVGK